jgi:hypothetical protein
MKLLLALTVGVGVLCSVVSAQVVIWSGGFNSDATDPYVKGKKSFGLQFGLSAPGVITGGSIDGTEGDGFVALDTDFTASGEPKVFGGMDIDLGPVTAEGVTYTFSGNFSWRAASVPGNQKDIRIIAGQTGFIVGGGKASDSDENFHFDMKEAVWAEHRFSYTTVRADVGKPIHLRIRLLDENAIAGSTQLLADDWKVAVD